MFREGCSKGKISATLTMAFFIVSIHTGDQCPYCLLSVSLVALKLTSNQV